MAVRPKERLRNGALVLRRRFWDEDCDLVLCRWAGEFVVWHVDLDGNAYWGHYFQDRFSAAVECFSTKGMD